MAHGLIAGRLLALLPVPQAAYPVRNVLAFALQMDVIHI